MLFLIILLISRLQPSSLAHCDNNSCTLADLLCPHVINCLRNSHNKVRLVASRALAVLCTEHDNRSSSFRRNLLQRCQDMLSELNWNIHHGALLGIHSLLSTAACADNYLDESLLEKIFYFSSWTHWQLACPPACAAIALDIWFSYCKRSSLVRGHCYHAFFYQHIWRISCVGKNVRLIQTPK